jgi:hypothetical protein
MSKKGVENIMKRAVIDKEFRSKLFQEPESAVADQDISKEELQVLKSIKLDKEGDFTDTSVLDSIDPEMAKRVIEDESVNECHTLFQRCYDEPMR